jgi:ketosteroid isomerase-like protein
MSDKHGILAANAAFYLAFSEADFAAMSAIWAQDGISCIHPGWPVLIGRQSVLESYHKILSNPNQEQIEHHSEMVLSSQDDGRVFCIEVVGGMALAATNWFKRIDGAWQLVHHQASPLATLAQDPAPPPATRLN